MGKVFSFYLNAGKIEDDDKSEEDILQIAKMKRQKHIDLESQSKVTPQPEVKSPKKMATQEHIKISKEEKVNPFTRRQYSARYYELLKKRMTLPAWEAMNPLISLLEKHQVVVLQGETGSGKTTQIPQFLLYSIMRGYNVFLCSFI